MTHIDTLKRLDACADAIAWAETQPDAETAWRTCERGDWLLWYAARTGAAVKWSIQWRRLIMATCECGRLSLPNAGEWTTTLEEVYETIEAVVRHGDESCADDLEAAISAAWSAASAASAAESAWAARSAARSVAWSAASARSVAWSAASARSAAESVAWSAESARSAEWSAWSAIISQCADIVRQWFPQVPE